MQEKESNIFEININEYRIDLKKDEEIKKFYMKIISIAQWLKVKFGLV